MGFLQRDDPKDFLRAVDALKVDGRADAVNVPRICLF